jgi:hypothetical protein
LRGETLLESHLFDPTPPFNFVIAATMMKRDFPPLDYGIVDVAGIISPYVLH